MFLRSVSSFYVQTKQRDNLISSLRGSPALSSSSLNSVFPSSSAPSFPSRKHGRAFRASSSLETNNFSLTGLVFQPFEEVKKEELDIPVAPQVSLARQKYSYDCEAAINEQINVEYNVSYVYHSLYAYFDRDNISLEGLAKFFKESSEEERDHAEKLMEYQNIRGGKVKLHSILMTPSEFEHAEKGDALYGESVSLLHAYSETIVCWDCFLLTTSVFGSQKHANGFMLDNIFFGMSHDFGALNLIGLV
ncbi:hypothetical protein CRYUN_Cryun05aG0274700 [Craigia yunnanensis]